MTLLIRGGVLVDTDPVPYVIGPGDLLIQDGLIAAVGPALPVPEGTEVIEATGRPRPARRGGKGGEGGARTPRHAGVRGNAPAGVAGGDPLEPPRHDLPGL